MRARFGVALARRAARMSLATWGKERDSHEIILPLIEYEEIDRSAEDGLGEEILAPDPPAKCPRPAATSGTKTRDPRSRRRAGLAIKGPPGLQMADLRQVNDKDGECAYPPPTRSATGMETIRGPAVADARLKNGHPNIG